MNRPPCANGAPHTTHPGSSWRYVSRAGVLLVVLLLALTGRASAHAAGPAFRVRDIFPGAETSNPNRFTPLGNKLFFDANDSKHGEELWKARSTRPNAAGHTTLVKDILPGRVGSGPDVDPASVSGEKLFFAATDRPHGRELWMTNSQNGMTRLVRDIWPGPANSSAHRSSRP